MSVLRGGCLCGAVRYETRGEPLNQRVCHCRLCQRAIGASFNARVLMRIEDVMLAGPIGSFHSSEALERGFCKVCGTTIFSRRANAGVIGLTAGSLDEPALFAPDMHIWVASKQSWLEIGDRLPQFTGGAPA